MLSHPTSRLGRIGAIAAFTLVAAVLIPAAPALAATGEGCPNEAVRAESNTSPLTGQPYNMGLPECRAYEMVSPLEKQQHDALPIVAALPVSVSPDGSAVQWSSQGAYAGAENYHVPTDTPSNPYVAQRTASGWVTRSGYPPSSLIEGPASAFQSAGVYSTDLSREAVCGTVVSTGGLNGPTSRCALRQPDGSWASTPEYTELTGQEFSENRTVGASSRTVEDVVFNGEAGAPFLSSDTSSNAHACNITGYCRGIYEMAGVGTDSPELRLVNVDSTGNMIDPENPSGLGAIGDGSSVDEKNAYQAISADGSAIFFTATPNASNGFGSSANVQTIFARVDGTSTVDVSNPSPPECTRCTQEAEEGKPESSEAKPAEYQGASADGSKVFFTTTQQLVNGDTDSTTDLYEYDFNNPPDRRIVQVSGGGLGDVTPGAGAEALRQGVVSVSEDGSHVYFVAHGVLTTLPNGLGQTASASTQSDNLYAYDTYTGETKFIATLLESDKQLWGEYERVNGSLVLIDQKLAQTTPDGRYLVFDSFAKLITAGREADTSGAQQVYRYDFQTGQLLRVSIGHEGFANNGNTPGVGAVIGPADALEEGASPTANERNRSISESGGTIVFVTAEQLQSTDVAGGSNTSCVGRLLADGAGCEVYVWHNGSVNMISDGQDPSGAVYAGMSATGSDVFFQTRTQLVGQDTDRLGDIYDARIGGGFPAPTPEPSCSGEACQGSASSSPAFGGSGTSSFTGGSNLTPGPIVFTAPTESKPLTNAQKLAKALKSCKKDKSKSKRKSCEKEARKQYGPIKSKPSKRHDH